MTVASDAILICSCALCVWSGWGVVGEWWGSASRFYIWKNVCKFSGSLKGDKGPSSRNCYPSLESPKTYRENVKTKLLPLVYSHPRVDVIMYLMNQQYFLYLEIFTFQPAICSQALMLVVVYSSYIMAVCK